VAIWEGPSMWPSEKAPLCGDPKALPGIRAFYILFTCACIIYKNNNAQKQNLWIWTPWRQLISHQREAVLGYRTNTLLNVVWDVFGRVSKTAKRDYFLSHVRPSIRMEQLGSRWTDFCESLHLRIVLKSVEKVQVSLKSGKNNGYFTWRSDGLTTGWAVRDQIPVGTRFIHPSRPALWPTQSPAQWVTGLSLGKVRPGRAADHSPPSSAAVMEE